MKRTVKAEGKRIRSFQLLAGMPARDQIRVMKAAFVLLPLEDKTIDLWCECFDYLLRTIDGKKPKAKKGEKR
jgi:hypothetical protein